MLTPEQARSQLDQIAVKDWNERLCLQVVKLPNALREIAYAYLEREADGNPIQQRIDGLFNAEAYRRRDQARERILKLSPKDRSSLFKTLFPIQSPQIEQTWQFYTMRPYQLAFRAPNYLQYSWIESYLSLLSLYPKDVVWFAAWTPYIWQAIRSLAPLFAATITAGGPIGDEVFNTLTASGRGDHEIGAMGQHVVGGLLEAPRPEGWDFIEKMLIAAQGQEGLRQSILSEAPTAHPEAFRRLMHLILDHKLTRFSATISSVNQWFGFGYGVENEKDIQQILKQVLDYLENPAAGLAALDHGDGQSVYLALWTLAIRDAPATIKPAAQVLHDPDVDRRLAAATLLNHIKLLDAASALLPSLADTDNHVVAQAYWALEAYQREYPRDLFERLEDLIPRLPLKVKVLSPRLWPWFTIRAVTKNMAASKLVDCLQNRSPKRLIPYSTADE